jgi:hypothetical protein
MCDERVLSPSEAAYELGVSIRTIYRYLATGALYGRYRLVGKRRNRVWLIRLRDVVAMIRENDGVQSGDPV